MKQDKNGLVDHRTGQLFFRAAINPVWERAARLVSGGWGDVVGPQLAFFAGQKTGPFTFH